MLRHVEVSMLSYGRFLAVLLLSSLPLSGCITDSSSTLSSSLGARSLKDILPKTVGLPENRLYAAFGTPIRTVPMQDGGKAIEFVERHNSREFIGTRVESAPNCGPEEYKTAGTIKRDPLSPTPTYDIRATTTANQDCLNMITGIRPNYANVERLCHITFVLDRNGMVRSYNYKGDLC